MLGPAAPTPAKRAYRRREVHELYGASFHAIDRAIREGHVKTKRYGRSVFLSVSDVERLFCPCEEPTAATRVSQETLDELGELLS